MRPFTRISAPLCRVLMLLPLLAGVPAGALAEDGAAAAQSDGPVMFDARVVGDHNRARFIADLSLDVDVAVFTLADPYRIVIDMPEVRFALPRSEARIGRGLVADFRYGLISSGKSRVVIDVTVPVRIDKSFVVAPTNGQPARLVVDVVPTTREKFLEANACPSATTKRSRRGSSLTVKPKSASTPTLAIRISKTSSFGP
jgi:N-acetylmuramoyl-L-alanine amidase